MVSIRSRIQLTLLIFVLSVFNKIIHENKYLLKKLKIFE